MAYERPKLQVRFADGTLSAPFFRKEGLSKALVTKLGDIEIVCTKTAQRLKLPKLAPKLPNKIQMQLFPLLNPQWRPGIMSLGHDTLVLLNQFGYIDEKRWGGKWGAHIWRLQHFGFIRNEGLNVWRVTDKGQAHLEYLRALQPHQYRTRSNDINWTLKLFRNYHLSPQALEIKWLVWGDLGLVRRGPKPAITVAIDDLTEKGQALLKSKASRLIQSLAKARSDQIPRILPLIAYFLPKDEVPIYLSKYPEYSQHFKRP